jgi:hypothetical protein
MMLTRTILATLAVTSSLACQPCAQEVEKIALTATLRPGASYQIEQVVKTTMFGGKQEHAATQNYTLTVLPHGEGGREKLVRSKVDRVRIGTNATADGLPISYDTSDRNKQNPTLAEMARGMMSISTGAIYTEDDSFKAFEGGSPADEAGRDMIEKLTDLGFPKHPVGPGDAWEHQIETQMGQVGSVKYDLDYKFTKMVVHDGARCALLAISGTVSTIPGAAAGEGFDLKSRSLQGVMYFDPELGAVRKYEINAQVDLTAYGKKLPASMTIGSVLTKFSPGEKK